MAHEPKVTKKKPVSRKDLIAALEVFTAADLRELAAIAEAREALKRPRSQMKRAPLRGRPSTN
jgi:hypothetical protein